MASGAGNSYPHRQPQGGPPGIAAYDSQATADDLRREVAPRAAVWPQRPQAAAFLPLFAVAALAVPMLHGVRHGRLEPVAARWGLRAEAMLRGEPGAWRAGNQPVPPLHAWCVAATTGASGAMGLERAGALFLPGGVFAGLAATLLVLLGWHFGSLGSGLLASVMLLLNRTLLEALEAGGPAPAQLAAALAATLAFGEHARRRDGLRSWWTALGAVAFAAALLAGGWAALWIGALGVVATAMRLWERDQSLGEAAVAGATDPTLRAGAALFAAALALAGPWLAFAGRHASPFAPWPDPDGEWVRRTGMLELLQDAPGLMALAFAGLVRTSWRLLRGVGNRERDGLLLAWTALSLAATELLQPRPGLALAFVAACCLLAAGIVVDACERRLADRTAGLVFLAALASVAWMTPSWSGWFLAAVAGGALAAWRLLRRDDGRRRAALALAALVGTLAACAPGLARLRERGPESQEWRELRAQLAALAKEFPDAAPIIVAPPGAGPPLGAAGPRLLARWLWPAAPERVATDLESFLEARQRAAGPVVAIAALPTLARQPAAWRTGVGALAPRWENRELALYAPRSRP